MPTAKTGNALQLIDTIKKSLELSYATDVLVNFVRQQIHAPQGTAITDEDVLAVMIKAKSMNLDPLKSGVYAFKGRDGLATGVSKAGFQQAMAKSPQFNSLTYVRPEFKKANKKDGKGNIKEITYCDYVTAVITRIDSQGNLGKVEGTAYFNEEFNSRSTAWLQRPLRMLENRAMCIACSNAFGWGVYTDDEVKDIAYSNHQDPLDVPAEVIATGAERATKAVEQVQKVQQLNAVKEAEVVDLSSIIEDIKKSATKVELINKYKSLADDLKKEQSIIDACAEMKKILN